MIDAVAGEPCAERSGLPLVLVGAGAAHLEVIRRAPDFARAGIPLTLIAPGDVVYSGMAPGVLAGEYRIEQATIRLAPLTARHDIRWIADRATRIDRDDRRVHLMAGAPVAFERLSLDVGSVAAPLRGPDVVPARPPGNLVELATRLARGEPGVGHATPGAGRFRVVVAGGGAAGCETALALGARWAKEPADRRPAITLLAGAPSLLPGWPDRASSRMDHRLARAGIAVHRGDQSRILDAEGHRVRTTDGAEYPFDLLVNATGAVAHPLIRASVIDNADGFLRVDATLRSIAAPHIFGAGDCVAIDGMSLPRSGVHAVRQGRLLASNLLADRTSGRLRHYRPPKRQLQIVNLGDGSGLAAWGPFTAEGRWVRQLKDFIDRRYVGSFHYGAEKS